MKLNQNYANLSENYLFQEIARRVKAYNGVHRLIRMGIGDVTLPLCPAVTDAVKAAANDMSNAQTFHGYGPEQGYDFLREKIRTYYSGYGVSLDLDEIFISDGAKSDLGNILDLFDRDNRVLIASPVYPVYVDTNLMDGRKIEYLYAGEDNDYLPLPDGKQKADLIYICSPNNPTGAVYNKEQLKIWVEYAIKNHAVILFDAAYEAFISNDEKYPHSIFEIPGAKDCAIEVCSLSKTAGFTGTRCGYTVVPKNITEGKLSLNKMWYRRQTTKFNGVSYITQKAAEAVFTPEGLKQIRTNIDYYKGNAKLISSAMEQLGYPYTGGINSPYVWFKIPKGYTSWEYFDFLLGEKGIVGTPGSGFGSNGEGFFRFSAFGDRENVKEAMERLKKQ